MSFEKQICKKCGILRFCYDHIVENYLGFNHAWLCESCYAWVLENSNHKDEVRQIMIECGIEDLD